MKVFLALLVLIGAADFSAGLHADEHSGPKEVRIVFTGDILLSRQVRAELESKGGNPFKEFQSLFHEADWVSGNLEGAVGSPSDCVESKTQSPCFAIQAPLLSLLTQAGFRALGVENNHHSDLGEAGRQATRRALARENLGALSDEASPAFFRFGDLVVSIVSLNTIPGSDGKKQDIPSHALRRKLRLARRLSSLVVVSIHWGSELLDWPNSSQRRKARWLVQNGADLVIGHHPHIIQKPECVLGKPVFFSLGNFLFDQKYPASKQGLLADCRIVSGTLKCGAIATQTAPGTSYPANRGRDEATDKFLALCPTSLPSAIAVNGFTLRPRIVPSSPSALQPARVRVQEAGDRVRISWLNSPMGWPMEKSDDGKATLDRRILDLHPAPCLLPPEELALEAVCNGKTAWTTRPIRLVSLDVARLEANGGPEFLFTLERHASPLDQEDGLRPYVYEVTPEGLKPRWRGTALAWPLIDATLLSVPGRQTLLCALHRGDSFLMLDPETPATRVAAYRWNGFGFSGLEEPQGVGYCRDYFDLH